MGALIDLTGMQFGRLRVIKRLPDRVGPSGSRQPRWGCVCLCGRTTVEEGRALRNRRAMSCRVCVRDPSRTLKYGRVYLIYFPRWHVLKIGFHTSDVRIRELMAAGGYRIDEYRDVDKSWETHGLLALAELFPPAFTSRDDARHVLPRGAGWTDSFYVDPDNLDLAKWAVMRAGIRKGNDFGQNPPATPLWRATLDGFQRARRSARLRRADAHRSAGAGRVGESDPAGSGVDREATVPRAPAAPVDGSRDPRRPCAGGRRTRPHVGAERPRMARPAAPVWARARACAGVHSVVPGFTLDRAIFTGLGERGRKRRNTRASRRERGRESACPRAHGLGGSGTRGALGAGVLETGTACTPGTSRDSAGTTAGMSGAPAGDARGVRAVRYRGRASPDVPGEAQVRATVGALRRVAVGGSRP